MTIVEEVRSPISPWGNARLGKNFADRRAGAFEEAYTSLMPFLVSIADRVLHDGMEAQDCAHEAFMNVWNDPASYQHGRGDLASFLTVCVRNRAISTLRANKRRAELLAVQPKESAVSAPEIPDFLERSQLANALKKLPPDQWEVLQLAFFQYLTHEQIAQRLSVPLGTVKSRIALALRKLRTALPRDAE